MTCTYISIDSKQFYSFISTGFVWDNSRDNGINTVQSTTQGTTTIAVPGMGTTRSACEDSCQVTPQYDPFCGSNGVTYNNMQWFRCAQRCGISK